MSDAVKSHKARQQAPPELRIHAPRVTYVPARLGGGIIKEYAEIEAGTGKLWRYSAVYINPLIYARDHGRVLGYDNAHGYPHRHYMGKITREPALTWNEIRSKFRREWMELAKRHMEESW